MFTQKMEEKSCWIDIVDQTLSQLFVDALLFLCNPTKQASTKHIVYLILLSFTKDLPLCCYISFLVLLRFFVSSIAFLCCCQWLCVYEDIIIWGGKTHRQELYHFTVRTYVVNVQHVVKWHHLLLSTNLLFKSDIAVLTTIILFLYILSSDNSLQIFYRLFI